MHAHPEKIFISYHRGAADVAEALRTALLAEGFSVWLDTENIAHGDRWSVTINKALAEADRLVLLLDRQACESVEVFNEWFYFYQHHKPLHVIRLDDCEPHYQLLPFQRLEWAGRPRTEWPTLFQTLVTRLHGSFSWPNADPDADAVVTTPFAPVRTVTGALAALEHALRHPDQPVALSPEQLHEIHTHSSRDLRDYRLSCYARWCRPQYQLDRRFVSLTLVLDEGTDTPDRWIARPSTRQSNDIREILDTSDSFAYVVLGAPGSGKTTVLRRLEMDVAREGILNPDTTPVPFSVSLAEYGLSTTDTMTPLRWLERRWATRNPQLPPLDRLLDAGRMLLLLDGLNELAHTDAADLRRRIDAWRSFLYERIRDVPGNRALFTCRTLDYGAMLSSKDVGVPHIRLEPMTREQVLEYIDVHIPEHAGPVRAALLDDTRTLSFYRTPYMLRLLVNQVNAIGTVPVGRVDAFTAMIRELLRREILSGNLRLTDPELLTDREQRRLRDGVTDPTWLPDHGHLIPALTRLAFQMQQAKRGHDKGSVVVDYDTAVELLNGLARLAESTLHIGFDTGILDEREQAVAFFHQLLQEFFAARQLALTTNLDHLTVTTAADAVNPALPDLLDQLAPGEPLPPLDTTGWEETTIMAAAMAPDTDTFITRVLAVNPALAGRCIAAPDVHPTPQTKQAVTQAILAGVGDASLDLRARIQLGGVLGLGTDPRYTNIASHHGRALVPQFATLPAGRYRIGAEGSPYPLEEPIHEVNLNAFALARWPVTNAEFALFIAAGGYTDDRWWHTDNSRRWREGTEVLDLIATEWAKKRDNIRRRPDLPVTMLRTRAATLQQAVSMVRLTAMDDRDIRDALRDTYGRGPVQQPAFWHDSRFNRPTQPVVGVSVYEAEAYCAWLSTVTKQPIRLPTEYEWEAAAHAHGTTYPYGDNPNLYASNTVDLHVRNPTPVGIFPDGISAHGCHDLSGNVFEWTGSAYATYPYPVDAHAPDNATAIRICRGGSWRHHEIRARAAYRGRGQCFVRNDDLGFRIARTVDRPVDTD